MTTERRIPPRPIFETLGNAVGAAIRSGNSFDHINPERWAMTYHCTEADVEAAWSRALTKETNSICVGDGK